MGGNDGSPGNPGPLEWWAYPLGIVCTLGLLAALYLMAWGAMQLPDGG